MTRKGASFEGKLGGGWGRGGGGGGWERRWVGEEVGRRER